MSGKQVSSCYIFKHCYQQVNLVIRQEGKEASCLRLGAQIANSQTPLKYWIHLLDLVD